MNKFNYEHLFQSVNFVLVFSLSFESDFGPEIESRVWLWFVEVIDSIAQWKKGTVCFPRNL